MGDDDRLVEDRHRHEVARPARARRPAPPAARSSRRRAPSRARGWPDPGRSATAASRPATSGIVVMRRVYRRNPRARGAFVIDHADAPHGSIVTHNRPSRRRQRHEPCFTRAPLAGDMLLVAACSRRRSGRSERAARHAPQPAAARRRRHSGRRLRRRGDHLPRLAERRLPA